MVSANCTNIESEPQLDAESHRSPSESISAVRARHHNNGCGPSYHQSYVGRHILEHHPDRHALRQAHPVEGWIDAGQQVDAFAPLAAWRERGRELGFGVGIAQGYATLARPDRALRALRLYSD